jgi:threonine/homoserine/homoserine lactone efflux protein
MITESSLALIAMGAFFGLTAGISPGPLLALVITETLKHNRKEGIRIALSPLITDLPIILITYFIFSKLSHSDIMLSVISLSGGIFFIYLGYETIKTKVPGLTETGKHPESLKRGITANMLNPHPYLFWLTVGIPTAFKACETSLVTVILYLLLFYTMLVGSKIGIAFLAERSKSFLRNKSYKITMRILAVALFVFAAIFLYNGLEIFLRA